jgi:hypothetical protein
MQYSSPGEAHSVHQLTKASLDFMVAEEQARNTVKGFWTQLLGAMERGDLPESFGSARPPPTSSKQDQQQQGCGGLREHIAVCMPQEGCEGEPLPANHS